MVNGQRAPDGFSGRALPHFPRGTRTPEGKGFVAASFYRCLLKSHQQNAVWTSPLLLVLLFPCHCQAASRTSRCGVQAAT